MSHNSQARSEESKNPAAASSAERDQQYEGSKTIAELVTLLRQGERFGSVALPGWRCARYANALLREGSENANALTNAGIEAAFAIREREDAEARVVELEAQLESAESFGTILWRLTAEQSEEIEEHEDTQDEKDIIIESLSRALRLALQGEKPVMVFNAVIGDVKGSITPRQLSDLLVGLSG